MCEDHVNAAEIQVDPATFTPELTVRRWASGDTFCPKGLGGRKKKTAGLFFRYEIASFPTDQGTFIGRAGRNCLDRGITSR
jgi:hypothetical protein